MNYEGKYRVTKTGNVYDVERGIKLIPYVSKCTGKKTIRLVINDKPTQRSLHKIVATVYLKKPQGYNYLFMHHPTIISLEGGMFWCSQDYKKYAEEQLKKGILVEPQKAKYKRKPKNKPPSPPVVTKNSKKAYPMPEQSIASTMKWS